MERFTVTTPIFYANGRPHIGHAYTIIAADILARLNQLLGKEIFFLTGTDEHGAKVAEAAEKNGKTPQEFVDEIAGSFQSTWKELGIEYTDFIRTTEERHEKAVVFALKKLKEKGVLYEKKYKGLYCTGCEAFVTEKDLDENGFEPLHKTKPIVVEEKNWFFKLSEFLPQVKEAIESGRLKILPEERKNEVLGLFEQGLEDFSVSRSKERLKWGITLPFDESQVAYVWVDALLNYITALGYGSDDQSKFEKFWPADIQLIGQDILKFHAIYWPAILLALDVELPKSLIVHGYFTVNGQKMSKTIGNVIDPNDLIKEFGSDATRYLLFNPFPFGNSGDIAVQDFSEKYNSDLANNFGNLVSRSLTLVKKFCENKVPISNEETLREFIGREIDPRILALKENFGNGLNQLNIVQKVLEIARVLNEDINKEAPWKETNEEKRNATLRKMLEGIAAISILEKPVLNQT